MSEQLPLVVGLGTVDPGLVAEVFTGRCRFVADPTDADLGEAQAAIVRADATIDAAFLDRAPRLRVIARTGVGVERVDLDAATSRGIAVVVTPGAGATAVAEGAIAMAMHLVKRLGPLDRPGPSRSLGRARLASPSATSPGRPSAWSGSAGSGGTPAPSAPPSA